MNSPIDCESKRRGQDPSARRQTYYLSWLAVGLAVLLPAACSGKKQAAAPPGAPVQVAKTWEQDMPLEIRVIGNVEAYSTVQVKALVGGQVMSAFFKEGQDVKAGDRLFLIDPRPFEIALRQAESTLAKDKAQLKNAEDDLARYADLAAKDYVTQGALRTAQGQRGGPAGHRKGRRLARGQRPSPARILQHPFADRRPDRGDARPAGQPRQRQRLLPARRHRSDQPDLRVVLSARAKPGPHPELSGQGRTQDGGGRHGERSSRRGGADVHRQRASTRRPGPSC